MNRMETGDPNNTPKVFYPTVESGPNLIVRDSRNRILKWLGYYKRDESKKFAAIMTIAAVAILASIAIGLAVHYVGADKMLHWFQGDFTSWFKHNFVTWITNHAQSLNISAAAVGGVALGVLLYHLAPSIKEKALRAFEALKASMPKAAENTRRLEIENIENHENVENLEDNVDSASENEIKNPKNLEKPDQEEGPPSSSESDVNDDD